MTDHPMRRYAIVDQHNWRVPKRRPDGSIYYSIGYRPPPTMRDAADWPGTYTVDQPADQPPPRIWGHGTYVEVDGRMLQVAQDFDTSG